MFYRGFFKAGWRVTDGEALIRSVLASPADDAPRLVYADWLEEGGRAEDAEFIRVQIELARMGFGGAFHVDDQGRLQQPPNHIGNLQERQMFLWMGGHGRPDVPEELLTWPMTIHPTRSQHLFIRRGFVERVVSFADIFLAIATGLFVRQPVMHVRVIDLQLSVMGDAHFWVRESADETLGTVPEVLWPYLSPSADEAALYPTADEAEAALSWACVRYGRAQAGLE